MQRPRLFLLVACTLLVECVQPVFIARAQTLTASEATASNEAADLESQVQIRKDRVSVLDASIQAYKKKIAEQATAQLTLQNQLALLDNQIAEKQLQYERTQAAIELATTQIQALEGKIRVHELAIKTREAAIGELVRRIRQTDQVSPLYVFLTKPSFSEYFARLDQVKRLQRSLIQTTEELRSQKKEMEGLKSDREGERQSLVGQQIQLQKDQLGLEQDKSAKTSFLAETQNKESEFQNAISELRGEQQSAKQQIADLQDRLRDQLNNSDSTLAQGDTTLQWPVTPRKGVSARFHDPTYPYRNLFEHPGMDLPTPVGTPIAAAAGGYVAWTRTGKQYGNYIMLVHTGGIATVYAHLTRFAVKPDTYVGRGETIGYSGGKPGDPGAGLSTGPHLHFEVRQNGIPVNPENFLPDLRF